MSARCTFAHVDLVAVQSNFRAIGAFLGAHASLPEGERRHPPRIISVVKANAYGHGAPAIAMALQHAGATMLACADIEEAIVLRKAGTAEILVFGALVSASRGRVRVLTETDDLDPGADDRCKPRSEAWRKLGCH